MSEESSGQSSEVPGGPSRHRRRFSVVRVVVGAAAAAVILLIFVLSLLARPPHGRPSLLGCRANLRQLAVGMLLYASDQGGAFPTPEKWCDLLVANVGSLPDGAFRCPRGAEGRCHYAMNPHAHPRSTPDTVLLFETAGGWNQAGGPELLIAEHHDGCHVAFVDGSVKFVKRSDLGRLDWGDGKTPVDVPNARRPQSDGELRYWLENMVRGHGFTTAEIQAATGLPEQQIVAAQERFEIRLDNRPVPNVAGSLLVRPYPGGRHPRIGFLEGAIDPQRETKFSVFTPWDPNSYVVVDVPEAIWSNLGLTYLAHTHIDTIWTTQGIELPKLEWNRRADGSLDIERRLPNGIAFGVKAVPDRDAVRMEIWLENGTAEKLTDLRIQICVLTKMAAGFDAQTDANKVWASPYAACRSEDGKRWIITAWEGCHRVWSGDECPCFHSDPKFPDLEPGQRARLRGWLSFHEGPDVEGEFARIEATGWRK